MYKRIFLDKEIELLLRRGCNKEDIIKLYPKLLEGIQSIDDCDPTDALSDIISELQEASNDFLYKRNHFGDNILSSLSTGISLHDKDGYWNITVINGIDSNQKPITDETIFDIASITKLFTLLLTFKLEEYGFFSLDDRVAQLDHSFSNLGDFTVRDLLYMHGELRTAGRVDNAITQEEANAIFSTVYAFSTDRENNKYSDIPMIVLSKLIVKIMKEKHPELDSFDKVMDKYILKPFGLLNTHYISDNYPIAGNGNNNGLVHDPKARALVIPTGHAGLATTSNELAILASALFHVRYNNYDFMSHLVSNKNLKLMGTTLFPHSEQANKGIVGLYQKSEDRSKFLQPLAYSNGSFTSQGTTGALASFDPYNGIENNILPGAMLIDIMPDSERYPKGRAYGFMEEFELYQRKIVEYSLRALVKKHYLELGAKTLEYTINIKVK